MTRHLIIILGDQLNLDALALEGFDPRQDSLFMAEVPEESTKVWSSKARIAVFLSAMRHFRATVDARAWPIWYHTLDEAPIYETLADALNASIDALQPQNLRVTAPGEFQILQTLRQTARDHHLTLEVLDDRHFLTTVRDFAHFAEGRKELRMEFWYRALRKRFDILMEAGEPVGGQWNFDSANRKSFGKSGPGGQPPPRGFPPDFITQGVIQTIERHFPDHPGDLQGFDWPVTAEDAEQALEDFLTHRLPAFGPYEDAMWTEEPWLFHSRLSMALNLKLLDPRRIIREVEGRYRSGQVPLESAEGYIRQIIGWREYVRGLYWTRMPEYLTLNALGAEEDLPAFFWTGETDLACLRHCLSQSLSLGYAHHIQRLMVIGLYTLLFGVRPQAVHEWFLAIYVDAVEWVELPNTLGMSQYGDGGLLGSKPYVASGKYIERMSNYCQGCSFDPGERLGSKACPYTTLYWDFLLRHEQRLEAHPRMSLQLRNLTRLSEAEKMGIRRQAEAHRCGVREANARTPNL
jgi:deoxyribodipyrimidine photolyase-related protein